MGTTPNVGAGPQIPLSADVRKAYEDQYDLLETAIQATNDPVLKASLMAQQDPVAQVISADNVARIQQTTAAFEAVAAQVKVANDGLTALKKQIEKINGDISMYAGVLDGIEKVLTLTGV